MHPTRLIVVAALLAQPAGAADFSKDVYPVLQRSCFECHGPAKQEGGLRLDDRAAALAGGDSGPVIVAGDAAASELLRRVGLPRADGEAMPPRGTGLAAREIKALRDWIAAGAVWPDKVVVARHWSYAPPTRPPVPKLRTNDPRFASWPPATIERWSQNPIDAFLAADMAGEGLQPAPEADRAALVRRLSFDLTGLPPSPDEVDAFVADAAPEAYARLVDRLLASPEFGVRWARSWLDLARYADSHGFQRDDLRDVWAFRDWVVGALNADMPFDQFTIEQVAGDLLPNATQAQRIATGFHRCTPTNVEAGTEPEESRVNQVIDRVNTTGAVWLGTTLECAQCHDHKYDPFTQRDFYGLLAYFNNTEAEAERANPKVPGSIAFRGPSMPLSDPKIDGERAVVRNEMAALDAQLTACRARIKAAEKTAAPAAPQAGQVQALAVASFEAESGDEGETQPDGSLLLLGDAPSTDTYTVELRAAGKQLSALRLEVLAHPSLPGNGPGRGDAQRPNFVLHEFEVEVLLAGGMPPRPLRFARAHATFSQANYAVEQAVDGNPKTGWAIAPAFHRSHEALFELAEPLDLPPNSLLRVRLVQKLGSGRVIGCFRLSGVFGSVGRDVLPPPVDAKGKELPVASQPSDPFEADPEFVRLSRRMKGLQRQLAGLTAGATLVMREMAAPRPTHLFKRGDYTQPGETIAAATPAVLTPAAAGPPNRLTLARWLVARDNPLTARVTVNRWWSEIFGQGIVSTPEDFGIKGERPAHPELLDWLAVELMDHGWSMKHVLRQIVLSAAYRQSSRVSAELLARDDRNQWLARGPRFRLDAEAVRDNALAIGGLLSLEKGGPPIRPPQPAGLWRKVGGQQYPYEISPGEQQYRRGLYVVLKRGSPYPSFVNFDASARNACVVKRSRSNTPLQALTLLNDPVYVEAAAGLARRVLTECSSSDDPSRITYAFRLAVARSPSDAELRVLAALVAGQRSRLATDPEAARQRVASASLPAGVSPAEFAAWQAVATAVLNLDETITKN